MKLTLHDGVQLAYDDSGSGDRTIVMTHGLGCDRTFMAPQVAHYEGRYRVINVDLRGHGESDKPDQDYHPDVQAEDIAELCAQLGLVKPVLVGHSLGGVVGLRLAHLHPDLLSALVSIDGAWAVTQPVKDFTPVIVDELNALDGDAYVEKLGGILPAFFGPKDDPDRRDRIIATMSACPKRVFLTGWLETVINTDTLGPIDSVAVPTLYIGAQSPNGDLDRIRSGPAMTVAQATGTGHFIELEAPDQINSMIDRFLFVNDLV